MGPRAGAARPRHPRQATSGKSPRHAAAATKEDPLALLSTDLVFAAVEYGIYDYVGVAFADIPERIVDEDWQVEETEAEALLKKLSDEDAKAKTLSDEEVTRAMAEDAEAEARAPQAPGGAPARQRRARRERAAASGSSAGPHAKDPDPAVQQADSGLDVTVKGAAPTPPPGAPPAHAGRRPGGIAPGTARTRPQPAAKPPEPKPPAAPREGPPAPAQRRRKNRRSPLRPAASAPPAGERAAPPPEPPQRLPPVASPTRSLLNWGRPEEHKPGSKEQEERSRWEEWWCIPGLRSRELDQVRPDLCKPNLNMYITGQAWPKPDMPHPDTTRRTATRSPRARGAAQPFGHAGAGAGGALSARGRLPPLDSARQAPLAQSQPTARRDLEEVEADLEVWRQRVAHSAL